MAHKDILKALFAQTNLLTLLKDVKTINGYIFSFLKIEK